MAGLTVTDWAASGRRDTYSFFRVDPYSLQELGEIAVKPEDCGITWAMDSDNIVSASITVVNDVAKDCMIRVKHRIEVDGDVSNRTLGTFFLNTSGTDSKNGRADRGLNCFSALWRHSQDYLRVDHSYGIGDNCIAIIKEIVEADGGHLYVNSDAPVDRTHTKDIFWPVGTNKLEMIETIAFWINAEIGVTPYGEVKVSAYVPYDQRPVSYTFEAGSRCVYKSGINWHDSRDDAINRVVVVGSTQDWSDVAVVELEDSHPYSAARIGYKKTYVLNVSEQTTHEDLVAKGEYYLQANCGSVIDIEIEHVFIPGLEVGMVVRYINYVDYPDPVDLKCIVKEMAVDSLGPGCLTKSKLEVTG